MLASEAHSAEQDLKYHIKCIREMLDSFEEHPDAAHTPGNLARSAAIVETAQMRLRMVRLAEMIRKEET